MDGGCGFGGGGSGLLPLLISGSTGCGGGRGLLPSRRGACNGLGVGLGVDFGFGSSNLYISLSYIF